MQPAGVSKSLTRSVVTFAARKMERKRVFCKEMRTHHQQ